MVELQPLLQSLDSKGDAMEDESLYSSHGEIILSNAHHITVVHCIRVSTFVS